MLYINSLILNQILGHRLYIFISLDRSKSFRAVFYWSDVWTGFNSSKLRFSVVIEFTWYIIWFSSKRKGFIPEVSPHSLGLFSPFLYLPLEYLRWTLYWWLLKDFHLYRLIQNFYSVNRKLKFNKRIITLGGDWYDEKVTFVYQEFRFTVGDWLLESPTFGTIFTFKSLRRGLDDLHLETRDIVELVGRSPNITHDFKLFGDWL